MRRRAVARRDAAQARATLRRAEAGARSAAAEADGAGLRRAREGPLELGAECLAANAGVVRELRGATARLRELRAKEEYYTIALNVGGVARAVCEVPLPAYASCSAADAKGSGS